MRGTSLCYTDVLFGGAADVEDMIKNENVEVKEDLRGEATECAYPANGVEWLQVPLHYTDKFDLLDKLIEAHINELRELCKSAADITFEEGNLLWFEYFEKNHLFFYTMLASKGAPYFRSRFLEFVIEEFKKDINPSDERSDHDVNIDVILQFFGTATVGIVEWWFLNKMPLPPSVIAKQVGVLLDKNL